MSHLSVSEIAMFITKLIGTIVLSRMDVLHLMATDLMKYSTAHSLIFPK